MPKLCRYYCPNIVIHTEPWAHCSVASLVCVCVCVCTHLGACICVCVCVVYKRDNRASPLSPSDGVQCYQIWLLSDSKSGWLVLQFPKQGHGDGGGEKCCKG